ncbi:MAG: hypothetical protein ABJG78_12435 [Cyclobacteriaceae bacterium]
MKESPNNNAHGCPQRIVNLRFKYEYIDSHYNGCLYYKRERLSDKFLGYSVFETVQVESGDGSQKTKTIKSWSCGKLGEAITKYMLLLWEGQ